jgi:hypothetical protein
MLMTKQQDVQENWTPNKKIWDFIREISLFLRIPLMFPLCLLNEENVK